MSKPSPTAWAAAIPPGLRALPQWVAHRSKKPFHPASGAPASVTDPHTWGTYDQARAAYTRSLTDQASGVGFVFTELSGLVFVDFDHVLTGEKPLRRDDLDPALAQLIERAAASTYVEVSPSGKGLHALFIGRLPAGTGHRREAGDAAVEVWDHARYGTVTGQRLPGANAPLAAAPEVLAAIVEYVGTHEVAAAPEPEEPERIDEIREALTYLDPDMPRPTWLKVGFALKAGLGDAGLDLFIGWSRDGAKYVEGEPEQLWSGFDKSGVGLGSIIWMAEQHGWAHDGKYTRPEDVFTKLEPEPRKRPFSIPQGDTFERLPVDWLWKDRIALSRLCVISGDPKAGKTLMVESLAALRSRGLALPGDKRRRPRPGRWVLLESEDDENDTTVPRLMENGADMRMVNILDRAAGRVMLTNPEHLMALEEILRDLKDLEALVVSPLNNFVGSSVKLDMNKDQDSRAYLMVLVELAKRLKIAVIGIHHNNKNTGAPSLYRLLGSIGVVGVARTILTVARKDDLRYVALLGTANRETPSLAFDIVPAEDDEDIGVVKWADGVFEEMDADTLLAQPAQENAGARGAAAVAWLQTRLAAGQVASATLFEEGKAAGFSQRTLERARSKAGVEAARIAGGWVWRLTPSMGTTLVT